MVAEGNTFVVWDYLVFSIMLVISAVIGIYFACTGGGQNTSEEFLTGSRKMSAVPVAISLSASFMSAVTVLGSPVDVYRFGAVFCYFSIAYTLVILATGLVYLPVFYELGVTSTNEYLELRFNKLFRYIGTTLFMFQTILYTGIVIYAPALALNQVTGLHLWGAVVTTGIVCTFYCTLGGIKAVVWTDVFQIGIMFTGFLAVLIRGCIVCGGIESVWNTSYYGGRLNFNNFDLSPLRRHTFWTLAIGGTFTWTSLYAINQAQVQRYISCKSLRQAQLALALNLIGLLFILVCVLLCGLILYAKYVTCDPWTSGMISAADQLMPYLVMDIFQAYPGVPGLYVACAYSGTLSTVSSSINALAAVSLEDLVKPFFPNLTSRQLSYCSKGLSLFFGLLCIAMAVLASFMGDLLQAALSIFGIVGGPLLGLYTLGMLFPCANNVGSFIGIICGYVISIWVGVGGQVYRPTADITRPLPLSNLTCNVTMPTLPASTAERPALASSLYSISYLYVSMLGFLTVLVFGVIASFLTGGNARGSINPKLIRPICDYFCCCSDRLRKMMWCGVPHEDNPAESKEKAANGVWPVKTGGLEGMDNASFATDLDVTSGESMKQQITRF
uniref:sodium-coupled monocarboxylate transporter 1 n=1 Tax=Myxine glutinosa TaxID=7769 RepID=UPI00358FD4CE